MIDVDITGQLIPNLLTVLVQLCSSVFACEKILMEIGKELVRCSCR